MFAYLPYRCHHRSGLIHAVYHILTFLFFCEMERNQKAVPEMIPMTKVLTSCMAVWPAIFQLSAPSLFMLISWLLLIKSARNPKIVKNPDQYMITQKSDFDTNISIFFIRHLYDKTKAYSTQT